MIIEVYTQPHCHQCAATIRRLEARGVEFYEYKAVDHMDFLRDELGLSTAPGVVVRAEDESVIASWGGFHPDKIDSYAFQIAMKNVHPRVRRG